LAREGRIILDLDETAETSHVIVQEFDGSDSEIDYAKALEGSREFFIKSFIDSAAVYTTSCFEFDDDETNEELNVPPEESGDGSIQHNNGKKRMRGQFQFRPLSKQMSQQI